MRPCLFLIILVPLFVGCEGDTPALDLGEEFVESTTRIVLIDTFSIGMSTVRLDSFITSGEGILLAGTFDDEYSGRIISKAYFQYGFGDYSIGDGDVYDSVTLNLSYSGYSAGDTTVSQYLGIHCLLDDLDPGDQGYHYNTSGLPYEASPAGELRFRPRPGSEKEISIRLEDTMGKGLFDYLYENENSEETDEEFTRLFKGFVLVPADSDEGSIIGYQATDTTVYVTIHTHAPGLEVSHNEIILPLINQDWQFNQITCDWVNNPVFQDQPQENEVMASETGDVAYLQAGLGLFTKMEFHSLPSVIEFENSVLIRALLYCKPLNGNTDDLPPPADLQIFETGKNNVLDAILTDNSGDYVNIEMNLDELYNENSYYCFDITDYLNDELSDYYLDPGMALSISFNASAISGSVSRLLIGGPGNKIYRPSLELLFLFYDQ